MTDKLIRNILLIIWIALAIRFLIKGESTFALIMMLGAWVNRVEFKIEKKNYRTMSKDYQDERFCDNCDKDTMHTCRDSQHERDSSGDYQECNVCKWYRTGYSDEYEPPLTEH